MSTKHELKILIPFINKILPQIHYPRQILILKFSEDRYLMSIKKRYFFRIYTMAFTYPENCLMKFMDRRKYTIKGK